MLQDNILRNYKIARVVPDHPTTSRLSSTKLKSVAALGLLEGLSQDRQVPQAEI